MDGASVPGRLTIWLFGKARCKATETFLSFPARPKSRAVFAALAFAPHPLDRMWLASALWPDAGEAEGKANLRRHVSYVEQWLKASTGCEAPIVRGRGTLALESSLIAWIDVRAFEDAAERGAFEEAVNLYGGDLLSDMDDEWIAAERERLRARHDQALLSLVETARARNENEAALRYVRRARAADPYDEVWLRIAMRVRYAAGDRTGALHEYEAYRALVAAELDLEPMPETFMLADSMRRLDVDLSRPAFSFESTSFVGRGGEEQRLAELVARERLVTVSGPPGVGKSRLALRCLRSLAAHHRDGAIVIDAGAVHDDASLERVVVRALEQRCEHLAGNSVEELASRLDAAILLDGCERKQAACAQVVRQILAASANSRVLISSRVPLGVDGEAVFALGPLRAAEAIDLFFERVRLARADSRISRADRPIVERICGKLDGLPLAIELAAARVRMSTLQQVELDVRRHPENSERGSLHAMYESSYQLLEAAERAVLRRLATFRSGWTVNVAAAACADVAPAKDVLAAFTTLVEHSLVVPPGVAEVAGRYSMLDATRDFAAARARSLGESERDARAHAVAVARHYVALGPQLRAERAAEHYTEVGRDRENVEAALAALWSGDAGDRALATDLSLSMSRFWVDQGFAREGEGWLRKALADAAASDAAKRLELLRVIGILTRDLGDDAVSFRDFSELVLALESAHADGTEIAKAQTMAANAARMTGDFDEALSRTRAAHRAFVERGESYLAAWATYAIGTTLLSAGRFAEAAVELERATDAFNDAGATADSSSSIANLALCHYYEGRLNVAHELSRESLARANAVGHRYYYAHATINEALILHALCEPERAWAHVVEATAIGVSLGAQDVLISCAEAACALLAAGFAADAAVLLGSVDNARERVKAHRFPVDLPLYDGIRADLSRELGDERFTALRARGRVTALSDAVARIAELPVLGARAAV
jgi:predicted ATPase/DNA-binding SARP family transcriptional activator